MTTKEQERKALAQIKKILDGLGENSYVGTAFEGCFEVAEENIENDFGCSMKQRAESAEKARSKAHDKAEELKAELKKAQEEMQRMSAELERVRKSRLAVEDVENLVALALERKASLEDEVKNAAIRIVENSEEPGSAAFKNAVSDHRDAKRAYEKYSLLIERTYKAVK